MSPINLQSGAEKNRLFMILSKTRQWIISAFWFYSIFLSLWYRKDSQIPTNSIFRHFFHKISWQTVAIFHPSAGAQNVREITLTRWSFHFRFFFHLMSHCGMRKVYLVALINFHNITRNFIGGITKMLEIESLASRVRIIYRLVGETVCEIQTVFVAIIWISVDLTLYGRNMQTMMARR